ncbi:MAG: BREX system P-loop protein BrxC [Candidatus Competibacteraceae bacterium]|nr:BREX system P-loop protein BrxC [Candidatus Competibacteraceae bacterium]
MPTVIKDLFANDINRIIEEVIKVDQTDEQILDREFREYVVTPAIKKRFQEILEHYRMTLNQSHERIGIWVSGFFGAGKSSFAKYLGLALHNRRILGQPAADLLLQRAPDPALQALLTIITEHLPTEAVIFDVSTNVNVRSSNQTLTEIMYRLLLEHLGYARDLDLAELEITLEDEGRLDAFQTQYQADFHKTWDEGKSRISQAIQQASRVMHELEPATYASVDSWRLAAMKRADLTPGLLAERALALMARRRPGQSLVFVVDEVGQYVARDVQKMLDLQAVVQSLGRVGRGKLWLMVTSQEKLTELVGGLDDKRVELARLMDRFYVQVHLDPSDISTVTSQRVLAKNAAAEPVLRDLFTTHRGRLTDHTRLSADFRLPELTVDAFRDLYPLLPYQIDLIIQIVSGLRTQAGASRHVGGANRTIIKLAQQLLIHPEINLQQQPVGCLARVDQIYDLVANNVASEVRGKIAEITQKIAHPLAPAVAKAICLLQLVASLHSTAENLAATLHPAVNADSRLPEVKAALAELETAGLIRHGKQGYRIPTPAEDDWERQRNSLQPKPADAHRLHLDAIKAVWKQPAHNLRGVKLFKAGLNIQGQLVIAADLPVHLLLTEPGPDYPQSVADAQQRSRAETQALFWVAALDKAVDQATVELFRSTEQIARKERLAKTREESALISEEQQRRERHQDELQRHLKRALLKGALFFRGNDRSPDETDQDVTAVVNKVLAQALPLVFHRFDEAAARVAAKDLDALMTSDNLRGLSSVFTDLQLVREQGQQVVFNVEQNPLAEVLNHIANRTSYGEVASGAWLAEQFAREPFGWEFDMVRLLVIALLRAGQLEATGKGRVIDAAVSLDARNTFGNNNLFRQATFRRQVSLEFTHLIDAAEAFRTLFGREIADLTQAEVAAAIRAELEPRAEELQSLYTLLTQRRLPGAEVLREALDQIKAIRSGSEENAILTFNSAHQELKDALQRSVDLNQALIEPRLYDLDRARTALDEYWPLLDQEPDLDAAVRDHAAQLTELLARETFFRELPAIDQHARAVEQDYQQRHAAAVQACVSAYTDALAQLQTLPEWATLPAEAQQRLAAPLVRCVDGETAQHKTIPLLRADRDACSSRLNAVIEELWRLIEGNRLVRVAAADFFTGGVETEEQLEQSLADFRDQCLKWIGAGKKVLVQ